MITAQESFPGKSPSFLQGQDLFYEQFNDVNFYIEDEDQERFYYIILTKLFRNVSFAKIFPLGGKLQVIKNALQERDNKQAIHIVDKDFDDLLGKVVDLPNLFYLEFYCIENYLLEENAIQEFVFEENPKIKQRDFSSRFGFADYYTYCIDSLKELVLLFLLVQKHCTSFLKSCGLPIEMFVDASKKHKVSFSRIKAYRVKIKKAVADNHIQIDLDAELKELHDSFDFEKTERNISGKYLIFLFLCKIRNVFKLRSCNIHSLCVRLAKHCSFETLESIRDEVTAYISS